MSRQIVVLGFDPAFANWGVAKAVLDLDTLEISLLALELITTAKMDKKTVRASSDKLRRAYELHAGVFRWAHEAKIIFAEVPSGTQSATAAMGLGIAVGVLAASPLPVIQVTPRDTKKLTVGSVTASKLAMIKWATDLYPDSQWLRHKRKGEMQLTNANEHLADATAVIHAGIHTDEFKQLLPLLGSIGPEPVLRRRPQRKQLQ